MDALVGAGHEWVRVYAQPPRPAGRGQKPRPSPVEARAKALGLVVSTPTSLKGSEEQAELQALGLDAAVVAAYGLILPKAILEAPRLGAVNVHASLLPRWRGAAPIQRALVAGDEETGRTIMQMDEGLDTGAMLIAERVAITADATGQSLHDVLSRLGSRLSLDAREGLAAGRLRPTPQPGAGVTYARKLARDQAGAAGTVLDGGLTVACGEGAPGVLRLQRAGGAPMNAEALPRGHPLPAGAVLS